MKYLGIFLKGILIGFVSIAIPGLSASTIAIILGIYFCLINSISDLFKNFKKSITFLVTLVGGYGIGSILGALSIKAVYESYPLITVCVILGCIVAIIPKMFKDLVPYIKKVSNWVVMIGVCIFLIFCSYFLTNGANVSFDNMEFVDYAMLAIVGLVTAATLVIPGVDFAVVLLTFGYYYAFVDVIADLVSFNNVGPNLLILGVYLVFYGIGAFILSKLIKKLIARFEQQTKFASFAFVITAPAIVIKKSIFENPNFTYSGQQMTLGVVLFIIAIMIVLLIYHLFDPNDKRIRAMKKRHMFRFFFTIGIQIFHAIYYVLNMRKMIKENKLSFEEKYAYTMKIVRRINRFGRIHVKIYGMENIPDNVTMYCSNHQGRYDGLGIFTALQDKPCSFVAAKDRVIHPMYEEFFSMIEGKYIDKTDMRRQVEIMHEVAADLKNGRSYIVFIEGKYEDNENNLQEFKTGVLKPAFSSQCSITPVVLYDTYKVFSISSLKKVYPEVHFLEPILYEEYQSMTKVELADEIKRRMQAKLDEINSSKNIKSKK